MAFPAGLTTCVVTAGSTLNFGGMDGSIVLTVTPVLGGNASHITWSASGQPLVAFSDSNSADAGTVAQVVVPHVDQAGFIDGSGNAATMWSYRATITAKVGRESKMWVKNFQPLAGQDTIDLDLLPDGSITSPTSAPIPAVTSVEGQTGAVTLDSLGLLSTTDVGVAGGVAALNSAGKVVDADGKEVAAPGLPAFLGLRRSLDASASVAVQVLGDSTGNETWEWPRLLTDWLAAQYPTHTVTSHVWDANTDAYAAPVTIQTGTDGLSYQECDGTTRARIYPAVHLPGDIDVAVKVRATDYTPASAQIILGTVGSGNYSWMFGLKTSGVPVLLVSTTGANLITIGGTAVAGVADGADTWLRCTFTPDDGAGNSVAKFYRGDDGVTWTQIGNTVTTPGALTLHDASADYIYLGGGPVGTYARFAGRIYEARIKDGIDGGTVAPCLPELWENAAGVACPVIGAPNLTLVNGSKAGADVAYLGDATRLPRLTPDYGQAVIFLSDSHNEGQITGSRFTAKYGTFRDAVATRIALCPFALLTQNPQNPANSGSAAQAQRRLDLMAFAADRHDALIDTYAVFLANPDWLTQWMADTVHPNEIGQQQWVETIERAFPT